MLFKKKKFPKLTSREVDIMNILWTSGKPLIASEIADCRPDLTINTVQAVLRKLLKYQLVEVADIVYSGTVLSRSYRPTITSEEFAVHEMTSDYLAFEKTLSKPLLVSALLDTEEDPVKAVKLHGSATRRAFVLHHICHSSPSPSFLRSVPEKVSGDSSSDIFV